MREIRIILTDEASGFIDNIPRKAADKMNYNIRRIMKG